MKSLKILIGFFLIVVEALFINSCNYSPTLRPRRGYLPSLPIVKYYKQKKEEVLKEVYNQSGQWKYKIVSVELTTIRAKYNKNRDKLLIEFGQRVTDEFGNRVLDFERKNIRVLFVKRHGEWFLEKEKVLPNPVY